MHEFAVGDVVLHRSQLACDQPQFMVIDFVHGPLLVLSWVTRAGEHRSVVSASSAIEKAKFTPVEESTEAK